MAKNENKNLQIVNTDQTGSQLLDSNQKRRQNDDTVEVLYQKMGDKWFAFSLVGEEVFVGSIAPEDIEAWEINEPGKKQEAPAA